jgi:hypothetical protein
MRAMSTRCAVLVFVGLGVTSCREAPAPTAEKARVEPVPAASEAQAPSESGLPVPEAVAKLHRSEFERPSDDKLGPVLCVVTLHDAALERGEFHPLVLFATGSVGTWTQTAKGAEELFYAELTPEEQARAVEAVKEIPAGRALARKRFDAGALVMGVSTRTEGERVETLYFEHTRLPKALSELVGMLKARLEATNR